MIILFGNKIMDWLLSPTVYQIFSGEIGPCTHSFALFYMNLQTVVYFYDPLDVEQGQVIEGSLMLSQSKENARFMNIHLEYSYVSPPLS